MTTLDRPRLRPLSGRRVEHQGRPFVALDDPLGVVEGSVLITLDGFQGIVRRFDGRTSLDEIREQVRRETGEIVPIEALRSLVAQLDRAMVLDGPAFESFRASYAESPVRPSAMAGRSYPADPSALAAELTRHFDHPDGSGRPTIGSRAGSPRLRGVLSPHIDYGRGGPVYSWAYRELAERTDADTFVILGVAHQPCRHPFALTRKDFQTPLGTARTDRDYVDRVASRAGLHLFEDELAHRTEHSIEFQVAFLQHVLGAGRAFSIVPILVGSFHHLMEAGVDPIDDPAVRSMVEALREAEAASGRSVAYIGGIDLCHVGPEFGDPSAVDDATLATIRQFDGSMLERASAVDPSGWFATAAEVRNRWRVCGLAATYTMLHAIGPASGRLLKYGQAVNPSRTCCVTFASVAFDGR